MPSESGAPRDGPVVQILVKAGAELNAQDTDGTNALIWAARFRYTRIIRFLIETGANIDLVDNNGNTARTILPDIVTTTVGALRRRFIQTQLYISLAADSCIALGSPERDLLTSLDDIARHIIAPYAAGMGGGGGEIASFPSIPGFLDTAFGQSVLHTARNSSVTGHKRQKGTKLTLTASGYRSS